MKKQTNKDIRRIVINSYLNSPESVAKRTATRLKKDKDAYRNMVNKRWETNKGGRIIQQVLRKTLVPEIKKLLK